MGDFSKGGVNETDGFRWGLECFLFALKIKRSERLFRQIRCERNADSLLAVEKKRSLQGLVIVHWSDQ